MKKMQISLETAYGFEVPVVREVPDDFAPDRARVSYFAEIAERGDAPETPVMISVIDEARRAANYRTTLDGLRNIAGGSYIWLPDPDRENSFTARRVYTPEEAADLLQLSMF